MKAADRLIKITGLDLTPYRVELDRLLKEAEARWQPGDTSGGGGGDDDEDDDDD